MDGAQVGTSRGRVGPWPPEGELLLCCARLQLRAADEARVHALLASGKLDWDLALHLASSHGLRPLLFRHLDALAHGALPTPVLASLWHAHELRKRRNAAMAAELRRVVHLFAEAAIPCIPYKGPTLAGDVYGDLALREFGDLDILVPPASLMSAKALLLAHGYVPAYKLRPDAEAALLRSRMQYHLVFVHEATGIPVELHWKTDPDYPVDLHCRAKDAFSDSELLLVLCIHGAKHQWSNLAWLVDVAELLRREPALDWQWIWETAHVLAAGRRLALGLALAHDLLDAPLPADAMRRARAEGIAASADGVRHGLFSRDRAIMGPLAALKFNLALYERASQKMDHLMGVLFAPSLAELERWSFPRGLSALYVPLRLARLLRKHAGRGH